MSNQYGVSEQNLRQKSTTKSILSYTKKRINIASNLQYFVEKYFPAITECNLCGLDGYRFRISSINRDLKILHSALANSAHILITSVSICSFSLTIRHTFSVAFKSRDRAGWVLLKFFFVFNSRENLSSVCQSCYP